MPCYSAVNCSERSEKGVRLFLLPQGKRNEKRAKQWIINLKRANLPKTIYVCEKHFTEDQFDNNRIDNKRPLRWNAIPTIFRHKKIAKQRKPPVDRCNRDVESEGLNNIDLMEVDPEVVTNTEDDTGMEQELDPQLLELKRKLNLREKKIRKLQGESATLQQQIITVFNADQIEFLKRGHMTGRQWQTDTIKKSLKLYLSCGTTGYEELRRQHYPLPSFRTLQKRIENFIFQSGILHDIFPLLEAKIECMKPEEKHAILVMDEMALKPGVQFDCSLGKVIGKATIPSSTGNSERNFATHATLVFMLWGITTRWKQTIAYEYTENS